MSADGIGNFFVYFLGIRIMSYSTFRGFLREQFPNLKLETGSVTPAKQPATNATPGKNPPSEET